MSPAWRIHLAREPSEAEKVGVSENLPIWGGSCFQTKIESRFALPTAAFRIGVGHQVLVLFVIIAVRQSEVDVARWTDGKSQQSGHCLVTAHGGFAKNGVTLPYILEVNAVIGEL